MDNSGTSLSGLLGVGGGGGGRGAKDMLAGPLPGYVVILFRFMYLPQITTLSFKEESDISSLNGHAEMTTNTVIRLDAQVGPHLCIWRESARALTHV